MKKDCTYCKHYEESRDGLHYDCKYMRKYPGIFQGDSTATAEICDHFSRRKREK